MSLFTNFLNLFKWEVNKDGEEEFNVETALNENWDKIDTKYGDLSNKQLNTEKTLNEHMENALLKTDDVKENIVTFVESIKRENIESSTKLSIIFGKVKKYFSDLKPVAFSGNYNDLTGKPDISGAKIIRRIVELSQPIEAGTEYNLEINYQVGNSLELFYCGEKLVKGQDYNEIGAVGDISNTIQFTDNVGDLDMSGVEGFEDFKETLEIIVRGDYNDECKTSTASGEEIYLTDSADAQIKDIKITGNHKQVIEGSINPTVENPVTISCCKENINFKIENTDNTEEVQSFSMPLERELYNKDFFDGTGFTYSMRKVVFDGTENWKMSTDISNRFYIELSNKTFINNNNNQKCTHASYNTWASLDNSFSARDNRVSIRTLKYNTIEEFKEFLVQEHEAGRPVTVVFEVLEAEQEKVDFTAEQEKVDFTAEQQLEFNQIQKAKTYNNKTHIYSTDGIKPVFTIEYCISSKGD